MIPLVNQMDFWSIDTKYILNLMTKSYDFSANFPSNDVKHIINVINITEFYSAKDYSSLLCSNSN